MAAPTYKELIRMLNEAEREATVGTVSVAELLTAKFSCRYPHNRTARPGHFLETVGRIVSPVRHQRLKGSFSPT